MIRKYLEKKAGTTEIVIIALIIAIGVNLMAAHIYEQLSNKDYSIYLSLILISTGVSYLLIRWNPIKTRKEHILGFFIYQSNGNNIIHVPRYDFSNRLNEYLTSSFNEQEETYKLWELEPLSKTEELFEQGNDVDSL